jgi:hypothetical protein
MRFAAILFALAFAGLAAAEEPSQTQPTSPASPARLTTAPVVVELFTSQGCSSCPSADALLARLAERDDVIALSLSVDYWDYLGWKDTLARAKFTERQRDYKGSLGIGMVYTPMMVVNGLAYFNGADPDKLASALADASHTADGRHVAVQVRTEDTKVVIEAGAAPPGSHIKDATLWLAVLSKSVEVPIHRGENGGRTITYHNVVRDLLPMGIWSGRPVRIELARHTVVRPGSERLAVLLQQESAGPILGAAMIKETR